MLLMLGLLKGCAAPRRPDQGLPNADHVPALGASAAIADGCEARIGSALHTNASLRASVAGMPDRAAKQRARQLLDEALQPLVDACNRHSVLWEDEAVLRAAGLHGDVRSLLGAGKRPVQ